MYKMKKLFQKQIFLTLLVAIFVGIISSQVFAAPKVQALKIKDLENVTLSPEAKPILGRSEWHFETSDGTFLGSLTIEDNKSIYGDGTFSNYPASLTMTYYGPDAIEAGSSLEITYDNDRVLKIYLPDLLSTTTLYVTKEGSTYYDATLTQLAQEASPEAEDLFLETKEASSPESQEYFKWEAEYHRTSYKGVEAEGLALGLKGYVIFRFTDIKSNIPITFTVTDGGPHEETFKVSGSRFNLERLGTRLRYCDVREKRVEISYTYFIPAVNEQVEIRVDDYGNDNILKKYPHSHYKEAHTWEDAEGKTHTYYSCKRCGKGYWGDVPPGKPRLNSSEECPKGDYQHPKDLGADIYFSVHIPKVYLVSRKEGEGIPSTNDFTDKDKVFDTRTTADLFAIWRLKVTDDEKQRIVSKYYLGDTTSPRPSKARIYYKKEGYYEPTLFQWQWDRLTIDWKKILPKSAKKQTTIDWNTKRPLGHQDWDYTHSFRAEGSNWYQVYISGSGWGDAIASPQEEKTHRISIKGEDENEVAKIAASYINVPYVKGGETYQGGVDCSGLVCAVLDMDRTNAKGLHDGYTLAGSDNDVINNRTGTPDEDGYDDNDTNMNRIIHPREMPPLNTKVGMVDPGDMWFIDWHRDGLGEANPIDHVGIYRAPDRIIEASGSKSKVIINTWKTTTTGTYWSGRGKKTIFRGLRRP